MTDGCAELEIPGATVRQIIANIEAKYPGFAARLLDEGRLRPNISIAVDGDITPQGLLEPVSPTGEVHFITAIKGG